MKEIKKAMEDMIINDEFACTERRVQKIANVLNKRQTTLTVVLENINDPHNVSAALRSCDAVGIFEVHFVYHDGQNFPKLGEKSSASSRKWVKAHKWKSIKECYDNLRNENKKIYATHLSKEAVPIYELDLAQPSALVFGNEHDGVSEEAVELADANFLIPQVGMIQSLNISVACAVSVYEAFRQRLVKGLYGSPQIPESGIKELMRDWLRR